MRMYLVDNKKNELMRFKVELSKWMYIVYGLATNENFNYLENRIKNVRKEGMVTYLNYKEYDNTENGIKDLENKLINDITNIVEDEIHRYNTDLGIQLYLVKINDEEEE